MLPSLHTKVTWQGSLTLFEGASLLTGTYNALGVLQGIRLANQPPGLRRTGRTAGDMFWPTPYGSRISLPVEDQMQEANREFT